jgi:membrane protease YdiL (CAAX protease family)
MLEARPDAARPAPRYGLEIAIVLLISLGQSAIYSILSIIEKLTRPQPLNQQTTSMNNSVTPDRSWLDLSYQLAGIVFPLMPALLALYLLSLTRDRKRIGFDLRRPGFDVSRGFGMAALIGIPGLAFYFFARAIGINTNVSPANLAENWWTVPVLAGLAVMNGVLEEVVMLGYLFTRFRSLGWKPWQYLLVSALIRGCYHLYQGFGGGIGNVVMGLAFGAAYLKWRRVGPLVVAHVILDLFSFIGYSLLAPLTTLF